MSAITRSIGLSLFTLLFFLQATAADPSNKDLYNIKFGPEFTFWAPKDEMEKGDHLEQILKQMRAHLVDGQTAAAKFTEKDMGFASPNGWSFQIHRDPGVFEVTMPPLTVEQFESRAKDIQDALFVTMYNTEHYPQLFTGGGHINIEAKPLIERPLLFRNFLADLINHSELFLGIFNFDTNNALSLNLSSEKFWKEILKVFHEFDLIESPTAKDSITFKNKLQQLLNNSKDRYDQFWHGEYSTRQKHTAFYLGNVEDNPRSHQSRIELRGVRAQWSIDVWLRQIQLIRSRILYLNQLDEKIVIKPLFEKHDPSMGQASSSEALTSPLDPQIALKNFYLYVTESGERWENHKDYLWPKWQTDGEIEKFESSEWFKSQQDCSRYLQ